MLSSIMKVFPISLFENVNIHKDIWRSAECRLVVKYYHQKKFAAKIRGHWLIENQVHWVKDVIFNEDKSKIRELQAARNLSLLYIIIMNVYRRFGFDSIKQEIYWLGNNWEKVLALYT